MTRLLLALVAVAALGTGFRVEDKLNRLLIYGDGFLFGVKEPSGWSGDTDNASRLRANVVFYNNKETFQTSTTIIYIQAGHKTDNDLSKDMEADVAGYRRRYPSIVFKNLPGVVPSKTRA